MANLAPISGPPVGGPTKYNPNMDIGKLMVVLFDAAAGFYDAIKEGLRVENDHLNNLTQLEQEISGKIAAEQGKKGDKGNKGTLEILKNELTEVQTQIQQSNATITTTMSAVSTVISVLGKIVATVKAEIDGVVPNM